VRYKKYWIALAVVIIGSFAVLGGVGYHAISNASPIPQTVATTDSRVLFDGNTIQNGQNVWQSIGGQEVGSIWGHGAYVAPDWSADWLHREAVFILDRWATQAGGKDYASLPTEQQASLRGRLTAMMRTNTYDAATNRILIDPVRAEAFDVLARHYADVFLVDCVVGFDESAWHGHQLYQQLAARAADRQRADQQRRGVELYQRHHVARGDWHAGVVFQRQRKRADARRLSPR
jgi:nitric oxide reductase large subunit